MKSDYKDLFDKVEKKGYYQSLLSFLDEEYAKGTVYPPRELLLNAFELTSPSSLKAVILGQDPYHEEGQAMGLSFSVPLGKALPPSLKNIYREIETDLGVTLDYSYGDLSDYAKQGVLLLNAYLSVRKGEALSHKRVEYDEFLLDVFDYLEGLSQPLVYLLWGGFAKKYAGLVHNPNHLVLASSHPSPLSANRGGWFGTKPFSKCNAFLEARGEKGIEWARGREKITLI